MVVKLGDNMKEYESTYWLEKNMVRAVLTRIHDPNHLKNSPFINSYLVNIEIIEKRISEKKINKANVLKEILLQHINSLNVNSDLESESDSYYHTIFRRYVLKESRVEVSNYLGLGPTGLRTYDRIHDRAILFFSSQIYMAEELAEEKYKTLTTISDPHNLPRREQFIPREKLMERVLKAIDPNNRNFLIFIEGPGGMGKTSLAIEAAYQALENRWYKGAVWIDARTKQLTPRGVRNFPQISLTVNDLYNFIGEAISNQTILKGKTEDKPQIVTNILKNTPLLLIIDNFETVPEENQKDIIDYINYKNTFPEPSKAIITGRHRNIEDSYLAPVDGMTLDQTKQMILSILEKINIDGIGESSEEMLTRVWNLLDGCPMAIEYIIGQTAIKDQNLANIVEDLENFRAYSHEYIDKLLEYLFKESFNYLTDDEKFVLFTIMNFPGAASSGLISKVTRFDRPRTEKCITQLRTLNLINRAWNNQYEITYLNRLFVQKEICDFRVEEKEIIKRALDYFISFCEFNEEKPSVISRERINIEYTIGLAYELGLNEEVITLVNLLGEFYYAAGFWDRYIEIINLGIMAADEINDIESQINLIVSKKAFVYYFMADYQIAIDLAETARRLSENNQYYQGIGHSYYIQGLCYREFEDLENAKNLLEMSCSIFSNPLDEENLLRAEGSLATVYRKLKMYDESLAILTKHHILAQENNDRKNIAISLSRIANVNYKKKLLPEAIELFTQAIELDKQLDRDVSLGFNYKKLMEIHSEMNKGEAAVEFGALAKSYFLKAGVSHQVQVIEDMLKRMEKEFPNDQSRF